MDLTSLSERFTLSSEAMRALTALARALRDDPLAPTTVRDERGILDDHLADSLVALELPEILAAERLVDLGAGAGLPGLVLAAARPALSVTLVEANGRKCAFMTATASSMGLINVDVRHARAEELSDLRDSFDVVTARALAPLDVLAEYAAPLLRPGGCLVAWRGRGDPDGMLAASRAAEVLGLKLCEPVRVHPHPEAKHRALQRLFKVADTPARFPRRVGVARKRPLGAASAA